MKIFLRLLALFVVLPAVELALLVQVDRLIGFWPTIGLILATGVIGSYLAKREGMLVWRRFREQLARGGLPQNELLDGVIILVAGALLITPGVLTDVVGFLGLIPFTRAAIRRLIRKRIARTLQQKGMVFNVHGQWPAPPPRSTQERETPPQWQGAPSERPRYVDPSEESPTG